MYDAPVMSDGPQPHAGLRALVVDDDEAIVYLVRRFLEQNGFTVGVAADGRAALAALAITPADLVVTDLAMPGMTGIEMIREARALGSDAQFIVLTAVGSVPRAVEAMKSGAFEFLEKPVRFEHLGQVVDAAMRRRRERTVHLGTADIVAERPATAGAPDAVPAGASPPPLPVGEGGRAAFGCVGRYEIVDLVGRGGMGEVYRCRDPLIGRTVAVKVLRLASERPDEVAESVARFQREAAAAGALQHPGIVAVHDLGRDPQLGLWYIVLELVDGRSLDRVIEARRRLPPAETVALLFQVADALAFAHVRGIVHRDVKPANVLVRTDGSAKLLDFGIAAIRGSAMTYQGRLLGSPSYMAPERIRGRSSGPPEDQFALGVMLYEMSAGANPFDGETHEERMVRTLQHRPERLDRVLDDLPAALGTLADRLMAKRPEGRFSTTDEVVEELARIGRTLDLRLARHAAPDGSG